MEELSMVVDTLLFSNYIVVLTVKQIPFKVI